jgi:actin-like protein 6A
MELETPLTYAGDRMLMRRDYMQVEAAITPYEYKWPLIECLINESIANELKLDPKEHPLLLSEPSLHDRVSRTKMTEILFEKFQSPAIYIVKNAVLSSYAYI